MTSLRIPASVFARLQEDLRRPHPFAAERVGFLFTRPSELSPEAKLLLAVDYQSVDDKNYIEDDYVGARINSKAIRAALQQSLDTTTGAFHVHEHCWRGRPRFSPEDEEGWSRLLPAFCVAVPSVPHGALVTSPDSAAGLVWRNPKATPTPLGRISVVGFPYRVL